MTADVKIDRDAYWRNRAAKSEHNAAVADESARTAIILGGGAPNMALMAGALAAFAERDVTFDVVSSSGAGALAGLLWLAPKGAEAAAALRAITTLSVNDAIYNLFPVNYKVFNKPGVAADFFRSMISQNPFFKSNTKLYEDHPWYAALVDAQALALATMTPSGLSTMSWGLCAPEPFVESLVDFDKIKTITPEFYMNAYNIKNQIIDDFNKIEITPAHFRAALAFPFIYGPYDLDGTYYYEGAVVDCLNFKDVVEKHPNLKEIVVFDVLGSANLIRTPRNLYDSWVLSMIIPLVKTAEDNLEIFENKYKSPNLHIEKLKFDIPSEFLPEVLDWSESNSRRLFEIGYQAGQGYADRR